MMGGAGFVGRRLGSRPDKMPGLVLTKSREPKPDGNRRQRRAFAAIERKGGSARDSEFRGQFAYGANTELLIKGRKRI